MWLLFLDKGYLEVLWHYGGSGQGSLPLPEFRPQRITEPQLTIKLRVDGNNLTAPTLISIVSICIVFSFELLSVLCDFFKLHIFSTSLQKTHRCLLYLWIIIMFIEKLQSQLSFQLYNIIYI